MNYTIKGSEQRNIVGCNDIQNITERKRCVCIFDACMQVKSNDLITLFNNMEDSILIFFEIGGEVNNFILQAEKKEKLIIKVIEIYSAEREFYDSYPVCIYVNNTKMRKKIMDFEYEKSLKYTKLFVRTGKTNDEEQRILILDGQLTAAENYIKELLDENRRLNDKLEHYEKIFSRR